MLLTALILLLDEPALAQRTTLLTTPRQTLTIESQADRDGQTVQWQRAVTTEAGATFRYSSEATFDGNGGVNGTLTGERGSATFDGTTEREGNTIPRQRSVQTEQGRQYHVNSAIELSGTGNFSGSRTRQTSQGQQRQVDFSGSWQR